MCIHLTVCIVNKNVFFTLVLFKFVKRGNNNNNKEMFKYVKYIYSVTIFYNNTKKKKLLELIFFLLIYLASINLPNICI